MGNIRSSASNEIERMKLLVLKQLKEYGSFHPTLLFSLGCLARLRQQRREYQKAERIYRRALALCGNAREPHAHVIRMLVAGYASLLCATGRVEMAVWLREKVNGYLTALHEESMPQWEQLACKVVCLN
jgi:hypothetical protein